MVFYVIKVLFLVLYCGKLVNSSDDEYRLIQDLKNDYDPVERPVGNHSEAVDVYVRILLQQILEIDERNQMVTLVIWLQQTWTDYKLKWDPEEYGNITEIRLPNDAVWKPDIFLFNSADENFDARFAVNYVVTHTGNVLQAPPAILKSSCAIDITWFPFDEQFCFLKYGSWTYSRREVNLFIEDSRLPESHKMDLQYYIPNGAWELVGTPAYRKPTEFEGAQYVELMFYMWLRRKTIYYGINWIIPSILFLLSNILGFSLPSECGEKITLQTTNLLSVTVFLGMVAEVTPPTSTSVPLIGAFFALQMVLLGSSVIITILVINISFRSPKTHRMSPILRAMFLEWVPWLCMMTRPDVKFTRPGRRQKSSSTSSSSNSSKSTSKSSRSSSSKSSAYKITRTFMPLKDGGRLVKGNSLGSLTNIARILGRVVPINEVEPLRENIVEDGEIEDKRRDELATIKEENEPELPQSPESSEAKNQPETTETLLRDTMKELRAFLDESKQRAEEEEEEEIEQADWRFMAMAIDRLCMFLYAFLSIVLPTAMYCSIPEQESRGEVY
ncbi:unnamed protein product [Bursaphelenchus okinawaensis]|uniref:Uncharacterized protein n=1 Tax=Bursaphelenchus okinawaensis TaxID=465554 RepID=A0A811LPF4_9BILA|nr:unnamed protein product [Bursaphelenchus okinawaensis]CAG9124944.1 unnamed protein product [Bursaphelenchus okinawaensis]